jgi:hypothetical protein
MLYDGTEKMRGTFSEPALGSIIFAQYGIGKAFVYKTTHIAQVFCFQKTLFYENRMKDRETYPQPALFH